MGRMQGRGWWSGGGGDESCQGAPKRTEVLPKYSQLDPTKHGLIFLHTLYHRSPSIGCSSGLKINPCLAVCLQRLFIQGAIL